MKDRTISPQLLVRKSHDPELFKCVLKDSCGREFINARRAKGKGPQKNT